MITGKSQKSIQLLILLVVSEILSTQAYTLIADDLRAHPSAIVFNTTGRTVARLYKINISYYDPRRKYNMESFN